jgi:hypothetical protein
MQMELQRLGAEVANLRHELHAILDKLIDEMVQAALAAWFRANNRETLKHALENEETAIRWAARMIRECQRKGRAYPACPATPQEG